VGSQYEIGFNQKVDDAQKRNHSQKIKEQTGSYPKEGCFKRIMNIILFQQVVKMKQAQYYNKQTATNQVNAM
jgi:hypothetical protein